MQLQNNEKLLVICISAVTIAVGFWMFNPFTLYFLNDDLIHIPLSKQGQLLQRNSLRPIGDLSVQLDYVLYQKNAAGYHLTNVILHVINTILVFLLSKEMIRRYGNGADSNWISLMIATLFFVYAFHSEAVYWILGRSGSLGTLFFTPALIFFFKRFQGRLYFILSMFFFTCGLFAYESVWVFPLLITLVAIVDHRWKGTSLKKDILYISTAFVLFALHLLLRFKLINEVAGNYEASAFFNVDVKQLVANFSRLFVRSFLPPIDNKITFIICTVFLVVGLMFSILLLRKKRSSFALFIIIGSGLMISFLPYLSLGISTHQVEGERYLYMPSIFACMLLTGVVVFVMQNLRMQILLWFLLILYNMLFLFQSKKRYEIASHITKTTFNQINLLQGKKRLFIDSLPQTVDGALVFRLGFDEGVQWLKQTGAVDSIIILSIKQDNKNWSENFSAAKVDASAFSVSRHLVRDTTHRQTYIVQQVQLTGFNPSTDAHFIFKNERLEIVK